MAKNSRRLSDCLWPIVPHGERLLLAEGGDTIFAAIFQAQASCTSRPSARLILAHKTVSHPIHTGISTSPQNWIPLGSTEAQMYRASPVRPYQAGPSLSSSQPSIDLYTVRTFAHSCSVRSYGTFSVMSCCKGFLHDELRKHCHVSCSTLWRVSTPSSAPLPNGRNWPKTPSGSVMSRSVSCSGFLDLTLCRRLSPARQMAAPTASLGDHHE